MFVNFWFRMYCIYKYGSLISSRQCWHCMNKIMNRCCNVRMTSAFLTHHEKAVHTRHHEGVPVTTQGWTGQGMTHKQQVCRKCGSSLHKVSRWSTEGLSMYNVNTPPRTTLLVLGGPMPQHSTKTVDKSHTATVSHGCARSLLKPCSTNSNRSNDVVSS